MKGPPRASLPRGSKAVWAMPLRPAGKKLAARYLADHARDDGPSRYGRCSVVLTGSPGPPRLPPALYNELPDPKALNHFADGRMNPSVVKLEHDGSVQP